jgi:hypothetical protein
MVPFGKNPLEKLQRLGDRQRRWQGNQNVHVIRSSADGQRFHFIFPCDSAEVWPEPIAQIVS